MKYYWTRYTRRYATSLLYMLQDTEYRLGRYLGWFHRVDDFRHVIKRRTLDRTAKIKLLEVAVGAMGVAIITAAAGLVAVAIVVEEYLILAGPLALFIATPFLLAYGVTVPLFLGWVLIQKPKERQIIARAARTLATHPARRIAVVGSFGKTTAKELLRQVVSEGFDTAATPGNMNTAIGISRFAAKLTGKEEILIFELGEEKPGDVQRLARLVRPEFAIITGINEAHLQSFGSLENTVQTIFEIESFVNNDKLYKNAESPLVKRFKNKSTLFFSRDGVGGWKVSHHATSIEGTSFRMKKGSDVLDIQTGLIGEHTIGVTSAVAALAHELGVTNKQIEAGMHRVVPFEHRMDPRPLHGAWIIDDTYNGNSLGVAAGLAFLKSSGAKRRVYVTPGLVETGNAAQSVHEEIGMLVAESADVVVLMKNSVTEFIKTGLAEKKFTGSLIEVDNPLEFYTNLEHFVAMGDIVLMQNDWTDNYQ
jgi:UDP-N-acetylmuramoyl-tripeptide--D-alanyl-D-alanine ligase